MELWHSTEALPVRASLLEQVYHTIPTRHIKETYLHWIKRFILFHNKSVHQYIFDRLTKKRSKKARDACEGSGQCMKIKGKEKQGVRTAKKKSPTSSVVSVCYTTYRHYIFTRIRSGT